MPRLRKKLSSLERLRSFLKPVPLDWSRKIEPQKTEKCDSYQELLETWKSSMRWRKDLEDTLTAMLAVAVSAEQIGDQLFLQVIGDPGSGKSRFCDAFLTTPECYAIESITGFVSGWGGDGDDEYSLLGRVNRKIMVTPEADVLMSNPAAPTIMAQMRRMFDGQMTATYKNRKDDLSFQGLRTPWIMAGTKTLFDSDQSRLGDRFLKVIVETPEIDEKRLIQKRVALSAIYSVREKSCSKNNNLSEEGMMLAGRMTGGYINYLKKNAEDLIQGVEIDEDEISDFCSERAEFTSDFRARPNKDDSKEAGNSKEMPTRLTHQYVRFLICAAAAKGETRISQQTYDLCSKVARDTARGRTLEIAEALYKEGELEAKGIANRVSMADAEVRKLLRFMASSEIGIVKRVIERGKRGGVRSNKWRLSNRTKDLMERIYV